MPRPTHACNKKSRRPSFPRPLSQSRVREIRFDVTDVIPIRNFQRHFLEGLGIDLLVEINPKDTREKRQHGAKGQEQQDRPDCYLIQAPPRQGPEGGAKNKDDRKAQAVTYVHRSEEISGLPIEVEAAGGTAIMHFREAPINGRTENCRGPASRTQLAEDAAQDGWTRREQEHMIADRYCLGPTVRDNRSTGNCARVDINGTGARDAPPANQEKRQLRLPIETTARS